MSSSNRGEIVFDDALGFILRTLQQTDDDGERRALVIKAIDRLNELPDDDE